MTKTQTRFALFSFILTALLACGGRGGHSVQLPDGYEADFEKWKSSLVKSCSVASAFPQLSVNPGESEAPMLDATLLDEKLAGLGLLQQADGRALLFGTPTAPSYVGMSSYRSTVSVNGQQTSLDIAMEGNGGLCIVTINGQEAHRTELVSAMRILADVNPSAPPEKAFTSQFSFESASGVVAVGSQLFFPAALLAVRPDKESQAAAAEALGVPAERAAELFPLGEPGKALARFPGVLEATAWTSTEVPAVGLESALGALGGQAETSLRVEWLLRPVTWKEDAPGSSLLSFTGELHLVPATTSVGTKPGWRSGSVQVRSLSVPTLAPFDAASARECFGRRLDLAEQVWPPTTLDALSPPYREVVSPCVLLAPQGSEEMFQRAVLEDAALARRLVEKLFGAPAGVLNDAGWDDAIIRLAQTVVRAREDLRARFPWPELTRLQTAISNFEQLRKAVEGSAELREAYESALVTLGFKWALRGTWPTGLVIEQLPTALQNVGVAYEHSANTMLDSLSNVLTLQSGLAALQCAAELDPGRRDAFTALWAALGEVKVLEQKRQDGQEQLLQRCWSTDMVRRKTDAAKVIAPIAAKESTDSWNVYAGQTLYGRAFEEEWTASSFLELESIASFLQETSTGSFCDDERSEGLAAWVNCLNADRLFTAVKAGPLSPAFEGRYAHLAKLLRERYVQWLRDDRELFSVRSSIEMKFASAELWQACSNEVFRTRTQTLLGLVDQLRTADFSTETKLSSQVRDLLGSPCP